MVDRVLLQMDHQPFRGRSVLEVLEEVVAELDKRLDDLRGHL